MTSERTDLVDHVEKDLKSGKEITVFLRTAPDAVMMHENLARGEQKPFSCTVHSGRAFTLTLGTAAGFVPMIQEIPGQFASIPNDAPTKGPSFTGDCVKAREIFESAGN